MNNKIRPYSPNAFLRWIWQNNFIFYYWFRNSDKKEFEKIVKQDVEYSIEKLVSGCGGIGNIKKIIAKTHHLTVYYSSRYLLNKEILAEVKGLDMKFSENVLSVVFYGSEVYLIASGINNQLSDFKSKFIPLDQE